MGPGTTVRGRYLVEHLAGEGGMGRVYCATDLETHALVALKVLGERGRHDRFSVEAEALASLQHEAIVRYVDHGVLESGAPFLVMEWLGGESLDARLARGTLTLEETLDLAERVTLALEYIHGLGIVHRDLKPSNVVLTRSDIRSAKIVDFGIARVLTARPLTATGLRLGTLFYMAPEQYFHPRHVDGRADVFALGCILFEAVAGRRAFLADDEIAAFSRVVLESAPTLRSVRPEVPEDVSAFVSRLLCREQSRRPRADAALLASIAALRVSTPPSSTHAFPPVESVSARLPLQVPTETDSPPTSIEPHTQRISAPPPSALPAVLPRAPRKLVGRSDDRAHLEGLLRAAAGVVTLWGPAGIGKTRLALDIAHGWSPADTPPGAAFVTLREATDEDGILRAVALALRPHAPPEGTRAEIDRTLRRALRARGAMLVALDGAEHVATLLRAALERWTSAAPEARFLVTSRERAKEGVAVELGPVPTAGVDSPAARLFLERAGTRARLTSPSAQHAVERIVRALDGNPLAIELAAARLEVLGLEQLEERLSRPLDVLRRPSSGGPPSAPLTMAEALAWSWSLLSEAEKVALARCSAFTGSFTVAAAEGVLSPDAGEPVLDLLQSLRDKSLLASSFGGAPSDVRLSMSAAIREFARAKLDELGLADATLDRHAEHYIAAGRPLAERAVTKGDAAALRALAADTDELLGAVAHALRPSAASPGAASLALSGLLVLDPVLATRGPFGGHAAMLEEAIARAALEPLTSPSLVARARQARGRLLRKVGRHEEARADLEHALAQARRDDDPAAVASASLDLGMLHHAARDLDAARHLYEEVALRDSDDAYVEARALGNLGTLHHDQGRFDDAYACYIEAIAIFESFADPRPTGIFLANLAMLDQDRGRLADAARRFARALTFLQEAADPRLLAITLGSLGMLELELGQPEAALHRHEWAKTLLDEVNDPYSEALCQGRLAATLASLDRAEQANVALAVGARLARRNPVARAVLRLMRGFVDVANAREALANGDVMGARAGIDEARARAREAHEGGADERPLVERSDDARAAIMALRPQVDALGAQLEQKG